MLGPEFVNVSHSVPFSSIRGGGKGPRHIWLLYRFLKVYIFNVLHASKLFYILLTIGALVTDSWYVQFSYAFLNSVMKCMLHIFRKLPVRIYSKRKKDMSTNNKSLFSWRVSYIKHWILEFPPFNLKWNLNHANILNVKSGLKEESTVPNANVPLTFTIKKLFKYLSRFKKLTFAILDRNW